MGISSTQLNDNELIFSTDTDGAVKRIIGERTGILKNFDAVALKDFDNDSFYLSDSNRIRYEEDIVWGLPIRVEKYGLGPVTPGSYLHWSVIYLNENSFYYANGGFEIPMRVTAHNIDNPEEIYYSVLLKIEVNCDDHKPVNIITPSMQNDTQYNLCIGNNLTNGTYNSNGFCITASKIMLVTIECFPPNGIVQWRDMQYRAGDWLMI